MSHKNGPFEADVEAERKASGRRGLSSEPRCRSPVCEAAKSTGVTCKKSVITKMSSQKSTRGVCASLSLNVRKQALAIYLHETHTV